MVLDRCLRSFAGSTYQNYEIIIVENHSRDPQTFDYYADVRKRMPVRVAKWQGPFNYSAANNFGLSQCRGDVVLLLNNDVEAINRDWMERMLEHALRSEVGAVGAKLYYPDRTIQHGGVILGLGGIAGHSHHWFPGPHPGYMGRLLFTQNLSAVTAACLMARRKALEEVGGFDERFVLAFNDVDLCMKIRRRGYLIVWTPFAELYHHESLTRGQDDSPEKHARFRREVELFAEKWQTELEAGDPYYNPNLTLQQPDYSLRLASEGPWSAAAWNIPMAAPAPESTVSRRAA
jgi:GT2 family glycosyltransferase